MYASAVGYFAFVSASSSASGCSARGRKPSYQTSNGSSFRPSRFSTTAAMRGIERRREDLGEQRLDARLGNLAVHVEAAADERRLGRRVRVRGARGAPAGEEPLVARVRLRGRRTRASAAPPASTSDGGAAVTAFVNGSQSTRGVVDDGRRDRLRHDALHDLRDEALLRQAVLRRVVRLDLVAEVPVREELQALRQQARPLRVHDVVHPDVVLGDVELGVRRGLREALRDVGRDARLEPAREARLGPLPPRPRAALLDPLLERREREVQERDERDLLREEVLADVRRGLPRAEEPVDGQDRPRLDDGPAREVAPDLVHVPVQRLEVLLEALEEAVQDLRVGREVLLRERDEGRAVAVGGAPERRGLVDAALDARALRLAVRGEKRGLGLGDGGGRQDHREESRGDHPPILSEERLPRDRVAVREHAHDAPAGRGGGRRAGRRNARAAPRTSTRSTSRPSKKRCSCRHEANGPSS